MRQSSVWPLILATARDVLFTLVAILLIVATFAMYYFAEVRP